MFTLTCKFSLFSHKHINHSSLMSYLNILYEERKQNFLHKAGFSVKPFSSHLILHLHYTKVI